MSIRGGGEAIRSKTNLFSFFSSSMVLQRTKTLSRPTQATIAKVTKRFGG